MTARRLGTLAAWAAVALLLVACDTGRELRRIQNVKPPKPGTPAGPADVQGIYRSVHQAVLQLRGDGTIVLIVPDGGGPASGRYTLQDGHMELQTSGCGEAIGQYGVTVTGPQKAGRAALQVTADNDDCATRRRDLTRDAWVYADS